jgi:DNA mismatch repair protein MutS2
MKDAFLATPPARKLRDEVLRRLASFATTQQGKRRLLALAPLPDEESCVEHAAKVISCKEDVRRLDQDRVRQLLAKVVEPREAPPRAIPDRMVVCESEELEDGWRKAGLSQWCSVGGRRDLARAADAELVVALYEEGFDLGDLQNVHEVPGSASLAEVCPEAVIAWFAQNRGCISACAELATLLGRPHKAGEAMQSLEEATRQRLTPATLRKAVEEVRKELDVRLRERVAGLQLSGIDLLDTLGRRLPAPLQRVMDAVLAEGRRQVQERTGQSFQPFLAGSPVTLDEEELSRAEARLASQGRIQEFQALGRIAKRLAVLRPHVEAEVASWLAFDAEFALGSFALAYDLAPARWGDALEVRDSVHLALADAPHAQRISYGIGGDHRVALLTGANSGGKTTILEHLAQVVLMARMGLPVVGQSTVPWVEELHYVTARRSLDAGAFEAFLRSFLPLAAGGRRRLVLADEVEAVTEMEAAGRIVGFFLDRIAAGSGLAVVVSHMAPHILSHCTARSSVRVDGIEASGLDEKHRLVVQRQPRLHHLARSTPELIVQRLAATSKGREQALYKELLASFAPASRDADHERPAGEADAGEVVKLAIAARPRSGAPSVSKPRAQSPSA